jgi:hypothetical protein
MLVLGCMADFRVEYLQKGLVVPVEGVGNCVPLTFRCWDGVLTPELGIAVPLAFPLPLAAELFLDPGILKSGTEQKGAWIINR